MADNNKNKGIVSLIVVYGVGLFALATALTLTTGILTELIKDRNSMAGDRSFYTAESTLKEGVYQYINSGSVTGNLPTSINNIDTNLTSYSINSSPRGWAYREVEGSAENNLTNRKVNSTLLLFPSGATFDYAVYSENDLTIKGSTTIIGNIFSNGTVSCNGGPDIQGDAFSSGSIDHCDGNADSVNEGAAIIPPPDIDPNYYGGMADCTSDSTHVKNDCLSGPTTGVIFADDPGNETNLQNINLTGNLTVIGDLSLSGGAVINASGDYAAIVVEGDLKVTGNNTITGLVYVTGNTTFGHGNTTITGSLVSIGGTETDIGGNVTIDYVALSGPPGGTDTTPDPKIISWGEE